MLPEKMKKKQILMGANLIKRIWKESYIAQLYILANVNKKLQ